MTPANEYVKYMKIAYYRKFKFNRNALILFAEFEFETDY